MKTLLTACCVLVGTALATTSSESTTKQVTVTRKTDLKSVPGAATYFTGRVQVIGQFQRDLPSRVAGAIGSFEPGARTAWHSHPAGQTLIVTRGIGYVQHWGGTRQEMREGDIVWIPPGVKHWHGASAEEAMTHIAIQEKVDGVTVEWQEHVSDAQYGGGE